MFLTLGTNRFVCRASVRPQPGHERGGGGRVARRGSLPRLPRAPQPGLPVRGAFLLRHPLPGNAAPEYISAHNQLRGHLHE